VSDKSAAPRDISVEITLSNHCSASSSPAASIAEQIGAYYHVIVQTISLKLPDDLLAQLNSEAKARRVTRSRLVRDSLEKALNEKPSANSVSCYDLARDLAGSVKGLPKDLATNPKYMEDFGK
jgi:predicted DNA-binding protein